jgi:4-hydroxy-tetrahydrodipicolinate synthase
LFLMNDKNGSPLIHGVYAALLTPREPDGGVDTNAVAVMVRFLLDRGISSFAVNGATGEYCLTTPKQLRILLSTVQEVAAGNANILCGIGAPGVAISMELASIAESAGVAGLLLPMPHFFPYEQQDLEIFCRQIAAATRLPILLYNLPQFSSGLETATVRRLITEVPNIIGIKDSSGSTEILRDLTASGIAARRMLGNDGALAETLQQGLCDGVVSGVACALPELISAFYVQRGTPGSPGFSRASELLDEVVTRLNALPTPWGLKWIAEARGLAPATFAQPVSEHRAAEGKALIAWVRAWFPSAMAQLGIVDARFSA